MSRRSVPLKDVTTRVRKIDPAQLGRETFRYVDIGSVSGEHHAIEHPALTPADRAPGRARQVLKSGDTVFSTVRPYLEKIAFVGDELDGEIASTGFCVLRPTAEVLPRYLFHFATSRGLLDQVIPLQRGVSYPAVRDSDVLTATIPLPSLREQRRVVDALEHNLSHLESASRGLALAAAKIGTLQISALRQLLPINAPSLALGTLAVRGGYGTSTKCTPSGQGPAVVRIPNLVDGHIDLTDEKRVADTAADVSRLMLKTGDLLVVRTNGSRALIGRTAVVQEGIEAAFASYLIRFQLDPAKVEPAWVHLMMSFPDVRRGIEELAASSAGQYNLSLAKLNGLQIPLPERDVRTAIIERMASVESASRRLRDEMALAQRRGVQLRQAMLRAAFSPRSREKQWIETEFQELVALP